MFRLKDPPGTRFQAWYLDRGKAGLDRVAAGLLLILAAPLMALCAVGVRIGLGRGVLFRQARAGLDCRPFTCLKFRTMKPDRRRGRAPFAGPDRRAPLPGPDDPRRTTLGNLLRRFCLDELPQLVNVLRGEMSLVGPRPEMLDHLVAYRGRDRVRFSVKPGLTGFWQVTRRDQALDLLTFVAEDVEYAVNCSLGNDLRILLRTPATILLRPAATEKAVCPAAPAAAPIRRLSPDIPDPGRSPPPPG
ncbi:MAG: sugar transferase [Candidatus Krumholzibacteriia bacterium]